MIPPAPNTLDSIFASRTFQPPPTETWSPQLEIFNRTTHPAEVCGFSSFPQQQQQQSPLTCGSQEECALVSPSSPSKYAPERRRAMITSSTGSQRFKDGQRSMSLPSFRDQQQQQYESIQIACAYDKDQEHLIEKSAEIHHLPGPTTSPSPKNPPLSFPSASVPLNALKPISVKTASILPTAVCNTSSSAASSPHSPVKEHTPQQSRIHRSPAAAAATVSPQRRPSSPCAGQTPSFPDCSNSSCDDDHDNKNNPSVVVIDDDDDDDDDDHGGECFTCTDDIIRAARRLRARARVSSHTWNSEFLLEQSQRERCQWIARVMNGGKELRNAQ